MWKSFNENISSRVEVVRVWSGKSFHDFSAAAEHSRLATSVYVLQLKLSSLHFTRIDSMTFGIFTYFFLRREINWRTLVGDTPGKMMIVVNLVAPVTPSVLINFVHLVQRINYRHQHLSPLTFSRLHVYFVDSN